ncbi:teichoic acid D-Ala incorporation-associated protein DltX [Streptococcus varani]|nr:teichoic acid D-Ala incorporation-associated protein DltX [Streptococcus varani]
MLKQSKYWGIYKFIFQTLLYFVILLVLLYFFGFAGHGQGGFIYNEF